MISNEPPDYDRWAFYLAVLEFALNTVIWLCG